MVLGYARARFESKRVLFQPTAWGWIRGARPMRLNYEHVVDLSLRSGLRRGDGSLRIVTKGASEPFILLFRAARQQEVVAVAEELASRARCRLHK